MNYKDYLRSKVDMQLDWSEAQSLDYDVVEGEAVVGFTLNTLEVLLEKAVEACLKKDGVVMFPLPDETDEGLALLASKAGISLLPQKVGVVVDSEFELDEDKKPVQYVTIDFLPQYDLKAAVLLDFLLEGCSYTVDGPVVAPDERFINPCEVLDWLVVELGIELDDSLDEEYKLAQILSKVTGGNFEFVGEASFETEESTDYTDDKVDDEGMVICLAFKVSSDFLA